MNKTNKFKRVIITAMAAVCALSSATAISASAKSNTYNYTMGVCTYETKNHIMPSLVAGVRSDTYGSYPSIYDGKSYAKIKSYVYHGDYRYVSKQITRTLQKNSPSYPSANYGTVRKGKSYHRFDNISGGSAKFKVTTRHQY